VIEYIWYTFCNRFMLAMPVTYICSLNLMSVDTKLSDDFEYAV